MAEKNYGVMKSVQLSGDDLILYGIFPKGNSLEQNLKNYNSVLNKSIAIINEKSRRMAEFYKK